MGLVHGTSARLIRDGIDSTLPDNNSDTFVYRNKGKLAA
jgi:hypothetical protein